MQNVTANTVETVLKAQDKVQSLLSFVSHLGVDETKAAEIIEALDGALFSGGLEKARDLAEEIYDNLVAEDEQEDEDEDETVEGPADGETLSLESLDRRMKVLEGIAQRVGY